ncbi:hypothetical protein BVRB_5g123810 isoform B [Beta vulgaris subsp. vulgaris]|nr:hypothetical protein BVRB_5g123810 isoform B [Beta vulgaris subsp. vulgaris]
MYGRGNYAPQFRQGLQRPMPPYQQQLAGHPSASHFQPGNGVPMQPAIQQGGHRPHGIPPHGPAAYLHAPPSMPHQGQPVSTANTGQPYMHPPLTGHNGPPAQVPYMGAQQNIVSGSQNPHPPPSMGPPRVPPPPPFMQLPPPPPPPPLAAGIAPQPPPLPTSSPPVAPPPPASCSPSSKLFSTPTSTAARSPTQLGHDPISEQISVSESSGNTSHKSCGTSVPVEDLSLRQRVLLELSPTPPKPADEIIVRNIEVLCQFIAKNGPEFEEMARKKESGNPEFNFLVGGDPGSEASCAHEYFLWMKKKCSLENDLLKGQGRRDLSQRHVDVEPSSGPNSLTNVETTHSPADSDVDMEDDITQSDKEHGVCNSIQVTEPEPVSAGDKCEMENENDLQNLRENSLPMQSSPSVKLQDGAGTKSEKPASQPTNIHSPFRLIQNYASDDSSDDGEPCHVNVKAMVVSPVGKSGAISSHDDKEHSNMNSKSSMTSETGLAQSVTACFERVLTKDQDDLKAIQVNLQETPTESLLQKDEIDGRDDKIEGSNPIATFDGKYVSGSSGVASVSECKDVEKEDKKDTSTAVKVDEFGRLVKAGASESEPDDSPHLRRRGRRDRSRSRSPSDRRRRRSPRRSPRRRKERRSRSRSRSPKRRRSRSRSPYRSGGDFHGEMLRRGKVQTRECFDFLKGRCYRGASCRYLHHEADMNENSRRFNSKQHQLDTVGNVSIDNSDYYGGSVTLKSPQNHNGEKGEKMYPDLDKHDGSDFTSQTCDERSKAESLDEAMQPSVSHQAVEELVVDIKKCAGSRNVDQVPGASDEPICHPPLLEELPSSGMPPTNEQVIYHPQAEGSTVAHLKLDKEPQKMDDSSNVDSSTIQTSAFSVNEPLPDKISIEPTAPTASASELSRLPPPPLPQQTTNAPRGPDLQVDYNLLAPSVSFPPQSAPIESGSLYQAPPSNQQSHYPVPSNPAWSTLPLPRPPLMVGSSMPGNPLQFQQGNFPLRNDIPGQMSLSAYSGELPSHSQVGGFPHQTYHVPSSGIPAQPFAGPNLSRDDRYSQFPAQGLVPSSSFVPGMAPQPVTYQGDSTVKNPQSFPGDHPLVGESSKSSFQNHQFTQQRANPSSFFDVGGSRISTHYNPYASTFDQPLSTRFSSIAYPQEREAAGGIKYDSSLGLGHAPLDGQAVGEHGSRQIVSSSNSSKAGGQTLQKSGGDQYDPLFDSIDPFSESFKKHAQKQDHAADNSDIMLKLSSRQNVLDIEENNKQKVVGAVATTLSLENDEFGETADAEVGAVENVSPSKSNEDADIADGDIEIDQVKSEGRSKKIKDSRSMKLFKVAVANFVKDVLKPQWRQGNMSKEVFKTIVKKTVDKVSGAMKNHRVPKSQAKIDHYIDSSRRKLTQLVEGYVTKYKS